MEHIELDGLIKGSFIGGGPSQTFIVSCSFLGPAQYIAPWRCTFALFTNSIAGKARLLDQIFRNHEMWLFRCSGTQGMAYIRGGQTVAHLSHVPFFHT